MDLLADLFLSAFNLDIYVEMVLLCGKQVSGEYSAVSMETVAPFVSSFCALPCDVSFKISVYLSLCLLFFLLGMSHIYVSRMIAFNSQTLEVALTAPSVARAISTTKSERQS